MGSFGTARALSHKRLSESVPQILANYDRQSWGGGSKFKVGLVLSLVAHLVMVLLINFPISLERQMIAVKRPKVVTPLFVPPPHKLRKRVKQLAQRPSTKKPTQIISPTRLIRSAPSIDGLTITFRPDPTEQLTQVLRALHGQLGFGKPEPTGYFQYLVDATDGSRIQPETPLFSLSGYFVVKVNETWSFVASIRARNRIPDGMVVYALFPDSVYDQVLKAIDEELAQSGQRGKAEPSIVAIEFSSSAPSGFRVSILATRTSSPATIQDH